MFVTAIAHAVHCSSSSFARNVREGLQGPELRLGIHHRPPETRRQQYLPVGPVRVSRAFLHPSHFHPLCPLFYCRRFRAIVQPFHSIPPSSVIHVSPWGPRD